MITNEMVEVCLQPIQEKFIRISLLQNYFVDEEGRKVRRFRKIDEIQGVMSNGSIEINANSSTRRSCSIDMVVINSSFLISEDKKIWMDKWFKVEIGIKNLKTDNIVWFNKGIYAINTSNLTYDGTTKMLHIEGLDLMCTLDGTLGGELGYFTTIPKEAGITTAIRDTIWQLGKISKSQIYIEQNPYELPYDIEKESTDTVYSILEEIKNLYMNWEIFFDENGRFIYQKIKNRYVANPVPNYANDIVTFSFLKDFDPSINYNIYYNFENVKNHIIVWGRMRDDGIQVKAEVINTNEESPFNVDKLGEIIYTITDDNIYTQEQAQERANYEFYLHNNMNEQVNIELQPLYFLDVNTLIEFDKPDIELQGRFLIDNITIPLSYDGTMSLSTHKVYPIE